MFVFIAYSFTKINRLTLNSFKKIKCNYGKTINCITSELYYYRYRVAAGLQVSYLENTVPCMRKENSYMGLL